MVCGNDNEASWKAAAERIRGEGARIETLSPGAFADAAPNFALDHVALALWEPEYSYADAFGATNAIARAARTHGAKIMQNTPVESLRRQGTASQA